MRLRKSILSALLAIFTITVFVNVEAADFADVSIGEIMTACFPIWKITAILSGIEQMMAGL